jgi:hypothetical protein
MASWQRITFCIFRFLTSSREKNLVNQAAVFCMKNALKLTSDHLRLEKIFRGVYPRTPKGGETGGKTKQGKDKSLGEGKGGKGKRGRGRKRRGGGEGYSPSKNVCLSSPLTRPDLRFRDHVLIK